MYRKITAIGVPVLIAVVILGWMLFSVWGQLLETLSHIVPGYLLLAIAICLTAWWLRGWRYKTILKGMENEVSMRTATGCIFVSQTVNLIVPFRLGDFVRIFILNHENNTRYSDGISSIVVERVFDIGTVALLGLVTLPFVLNADPTYRLVILIVLALCASFFVFLFFVNRLESENRYIRIILSMLHEIRKASLTPRSIVVLGCSSLAIWMLDVFVCYAVVLMFGQEIGFATIVFAIVIGNLIKAVPITPGGMGTYELLVAGTLTLGGMPEVYAKLVAIIDHLIKNLVTLAGGIVMIWLFGDWVLPSIKKALDNRFDSGNDQEQKPGA
jgi:uncharacterized membrane protein YbhN (UPF0104 family)